MSGNIGDNSSVGQGPKVDGPYLDDNYVIEIKDEPQQPFVPIHDIDIDDEEPEENDGEAGIGENTKALLSHADRMWKAEENNATRLATRGNFVLTGITAIVGLKIYKLSDELDAIFAAPPGWKVFYFWNLSAASVLCLLASFFIIMAVKIGGFENDAASAGLDLSNKYIKNPEKYKTTSIVASKTIRAANDLRDRNSRRQSRIDRAQILLLAAIVCVFVSSALYLSVRSVNGTNATTQVGVGQKP